MASKSRFLDTPSVSAFGSSNNSLTSTSASYAATATSASYAVTASHALFAVSASHEIVKEVSSSHANTADVAGGLQGQPSISVTNVTASSNISSSGTVTGLSGSFSELSGNSPLTVNGTVNFIDTVNLSSNISGSATSTASFGTYLGDGSQLTGISSGGSTFPFSGSAVITGSLIISGSQTSNTKAVEKVDLGRYHIKTLNSYDTGFFGTLGGQLIISSSDFTYKSPTLVLDRGAGGPSGATDGLNLWVKKDLFVGGSSQLDNNIMTIFKVSGSATTGNGGQIDLGGTGLTTYINLNGHLTASAGVNISASATSTITSGFVTSITSSHDYIQAIEGGNNIKIDGKDGGVSLHYTEDPDFASIEIADNIKLNVSSDSASIDLSQGGIEFRGPIKTYAITASVNVSSSATSTASFGTYLGDGSQLSGVSSTPFPFTGDAQITGSLSVSGSGISFIASGGTVFSISETGSFTLGEGATATSDNQVAIGKSATAAGTGGVAIGQSANATSNGVSIGNNSNASLVNTVAIGGYSSATGQTATAVGNDADVSGYAAIGIGAMINNSAGRSVVFNATGENAVNHSKASASAFYMTSKTIPDFEFVAGGTSTLANSNLSGSATSTASFGTYLGDGSQLSGISAGSTFPFNGDAVITGSLLISGSSEVTGSFSVTSDAGHMFQINNDGTFTLGDGATVSSTNSTAVGNGADASANATAYGHSANASTGGTSIGSYSSTTANYGLAFGYDADSTAAHAISIGSGIVNSGADSIVLGGGGTTSQATNSDEKVFKVFMTNNLTPDVQFGNFSTKSILRSNIEMNNPSASAATSSLAVHGSGSTVFEVLGSVGTLFSVDDSLTGTVFSANDISGLPVLQADATGEVYLGKSPQSLYTTATISSTTANITQSIYGLSTSSYEGVFVDYTATSASNARAGNITAIWNGSSLNFAETTTTDIGDTSNLIMQIAISQSQAQVQSYSTAASYKIKTIIRSI